MLALWLTYSKVKKSRLLKDRFPEIFAQIHPTKNDPKINLNKLTYGSHTELWWKCPVAKCDHHEWSVSVKNRTAKGGRDCRFCAGKQTCRCDSFGVNYPDLATEFIDAGNNESVAYSTSVKSGKSFWWKGKCGHRWRTVVSSRTAGFGCGACANKILKTHQQFLQEASETHGNEYSYVEKYKGDAYPIKIIHNSCGREFPQRPGCHIRGNGCPDCAAGKSERLCRDITEDELPGFKFPSTKPKWLREGKSSLQVDCLNEEIKPTLGVEYDGDQHARKHKFFHRDEGALQRQNDRDIRKNKGFIKRGAKLVRVPHIYDYRNPEAMRQFIRKRLIEEGYEKYMKPNNKRPHDEDKENTPPPPAKRLKQSTLQF